MTTVEVADVLRRPAWRGGFARLWTAGVSSLGDALRTAALTLLADRMPHRTAPCADPGRKVRTACLPLMGAVRDLGALLVALLLLGAMAMVWNVNQVTMTRHRGPESMLGRIASAFRTASTSGAPLGALLGGSMARVYGLNEPALLAAVLFGLAVTSLTTVRKPDVPVVAPDDGVTRGHPTP